MEFNDFIISAMESVLQFNYWHNKSISLIKNKSMPATFWIMSVLAHCYWIRMAVIPNTSHDAITFPRLQNKPVEMAIAIPSLSLKIWTKFRVPFQERYILFFKLFLLTYVSPLIICTDHFHITSIEEVFIVNVFESSKKCRIWCLKQANKSDISMLFSEKKGYTWKIITDKLFYISLLFSICI